MVGRLVEQVDYYGAGSTRAKSGGGTQDISGWIKHAETMSYDKDGRLLSQTSKGRVKGWVAATTATGQSDLSKLSTLTVTTQRYDGLSRSSGYTWNYKEHDETYAGSASDAKNYTHTYAITYEGRDGYLEKSNYGYSSNSSFKASTATSQYDAWGRLIAVREHTPKQSDTDDRVRYMSLDGDGMILRRREGTYKNNAFSQTTAEKGRDAVFTYGSGQQLAEQTRDGTKLDVFGLMGMRDAGPAGKDQQKFINKQARKGNVMGAYDQIAQRYSVYGQDGATRVQVQSGDSLQGIAQRVYGNSSLWYVLAAANALSGDSELIAGTQLRVPEVGVSKNDASTFKPYNPNEIIGSTSPSLPYIPPAKSNTCAVVAMAIVAIVVTIYTAGAATSALAPLFGVSGSVFAGTTATLGMTALTGGLTGFAGLGMAAAAVGGLVGSIAAQVVGKALGAVDNFSWRQAVGAGITGGLTAGIGSYLGPMSQLITNGQWGRVAASAALTATGSYVGNEIAGVKGNAFSWKSIAASAVTAVVAGKINKSLGTVYDKFNGINAIAGQTVGGMVSNAVSVNVRRAFGIHERTDWKAMAADAFGNAVGNSIVSEISGFETMRTQAMGMAESLELDFSDRAVRNKLYAAIKASHSIDSEYRINAAADVLALKYSGDELNEQIDLMNRHFNFQPTATAGPLMPYRDISADETQLHASGISTLPTEYSNQYAQVEEPSPFLGSRFADNTAVRVGQYGVELGAQIAKRPWLGATLVVLDVAAGPGMYVVREAIMKSPVGNYIKEKQADVMYYLADQFSDAGYGTEQANYGAAGTFLIGAGMVMGAKQGLNLLRNAWGKLTGVGKGNNIGSVASKFDPVIGKIPATQYAKLRSQSVHNADSDTLMLGKFNPVPGPNGKPIAGPASYIERAKAEKAMYFDMGDSWNSTQTSFSLSRDEMFSAFNVPVLDAAATAGKTIKFSHDPRLDRNFLGDEWAYLQKAHGYTAIKRNGGFWYAVK